MRVVWNALCVCIVIPLIFFRKVKEEEEAGVEGEVMVKEEEGGGNTERGGKGRSGKVGRRNDKCKFQSHILCMYACRVPHATTAFWNNLGILTLSIWTAPHASKLLACNLSKRWGKVKEEKGKRGKRGGRGRNGRRT